jgi:uncharacterized protein YgbK (DUF1537 family)
MKIGVIGDDFSGSSDIANTLAKAGARTVQYVGIPEGTARKGLDAAVVSLKSRSIAPAEAVDQSIAACRWLLANRAEQIVFKYCSTFDSTPQGNIGPVAEALLEELEAPLALVCPAFPANGRTIYQGHLFVRDRLLNESGMEKHPLTPMTDPDIRRWLQRQTRVKVGHLPLSVIRGCAIGETLADAHRTGARLLVADAVDDGDLRELGVAAAGHRLVTGGSAIAAGLPANFGIRPTSGASSTFSGVEGPAIILSGSCSEATRGQVAAYSAAHPALRIEAAEVNESETAASRIVRFIESNRDMAPLVYSTTDPAEVAAAQQRYGSERISAAFENLFAGLAEWAIAAGFCRIVVAGGETSGAVASTFGRLALDIGPEIDPGVPALLVDHNPRLALALKSGNFGCPDFFEKALRILRGGAP